MTVRSRSGRPTRRPPRDDQRQKDVGLQPQVRAGQQRVDGARADEKHRGRETEPARCQGRPYYEGHRDEAERYSTQHASSLTGHGCPRRRGAAARSVARPTLQ
jgi:hypothetical protein